jgi:hypothetical protein
MDCDGSATRGESGVHSVRVSVGARWLSVQWGLDKGLGGSPL